MLLTKSIFINDKVNALVHANWGQNGNVRNNHSKIGFLRIGSIKADEILSAKRKFLTRRKRVTVALDVLNSAREVIGAVNSSSSVGNDSPRCDAALHANHWQDTIVCDCHILREELLRIHGNRFGKS